MIHQGPLPAALHGVIEYLAAALFIVAPFLLAFESGWATGVSIVVGVLVLVLAATTKGSTSLVNQVPVAAHVLVDFLLAAFLIAAPFLFGFSTETAPTAFFISLGVLHLLLTIATRFAPPGAPEPSAAPTRPAGARAGAPAEGRGSAGDPARPAGRGAGEGAAPPAGGGPAAGEG